MNIYMYWKGDQSKIKDMKEAVIASGNTPIIGPTKEEDKFLMDTIKYYRDSYDQKIWSFCSDVWRFWKLSENEGLYLDANEIIGPGFDTLVNEIKNYDGLVVKGSSHNISSSLLYSTKSTKEYYLKAYNLYKKYNQEDPRLFPIGPNIITYVLNKKYSIGFNEEVNDNFCFKPYPFMRDKNTYMKVGSASWSRGFNAAIYSQAVEDAFKNGKPKDNQYSGRYFFMDKFNPISVNGLRDAYDVAPRSKLKSLRSIYKKIDYKMSFSEHLIWSRFYRFFVRGTK